MSLVEVFMLQQKRREPAIVSESTTVILGAQRVAPLPLELLLSLQFPFPFSSYDNNKDSADVLSNAFVVMPRRAASSLLLS